MYLQSSKKPLSLSNKNPKLKLCLNLWGRFFAYFCNGIKAIFEYILQAHHMIQKNSFKRFGFLFIGILLVAFTPMLNAQFSSLGIGIRGFKCHRLTGNGGTYVPQWQDTLAIGSPEDSNIVFLAPVFKDALLDQKIRNLPFYTVKVPLQANEEIFSVSSVGQNSRETESSLYYLSTKEAKLQNQSDWYPAAHVVKGERVIQQKKHYQLFRN